MSAAMITCFVRLSQANRSAAFGDCRIPVLAFTILAIVSCEGMERSPAPDVIDVVSLAELGWEAEFGLSGAGNPLALLNRVRDAIAIQDEILILDGSPPWIRVYDRSGSFLRSMVLAGDGPGEARNPLSITGTGTDGFLLSEPSRVTRFDRAGSPLDVTSFENFFVRGAVDACDGAVVALARARGESASPPGLLLRLSSDGASLDTMVVMGPMREQFAPATHPSFLSAQGGEILIYPEEADRERLLSVTCAAGEQETIPLRPLGTPGRWGAYPEPDGPGVVQHPAEPPFPAGAIPLGDSVIWAAQILAGEASRDSLTVLSVMTRDGGEVGRLIVAGWIMLMDGTSDAGILIRARDPVDRVLVVSSERILALLSDSAWTN
jgi:hypothetical protein